MSKKQIIEQELDSKLKDLAVCVLIHGLTHPRTYRKIDEIKLLFENYNSKQSVENMIEQGEYMNGLWKQARDFYSDSLTEFMAYHAPSNLYDERVENNQS